MTLYQAWNKKQPSVSLTKIFGCIACTNVPNYMKFKFDTKGKKYLFLDYCKGTMAYRLMCLDSKRSLKVIILNFRIEECL